MTRLTLSPAKLALLDNLLQQNGLAQRNARKISRSQQAGPAPLSHGQQRLWFLQQLDPGSHLYNIPIAIRLEGRLDIAALQQSLNQLIRRHESLRTVFRSENGRTIQVVNAPFPLELNPVLVQAASAAAIDEEIARHAANEAHHVFDLVKGPLVRSKLLRVSEDQHVLLLFIHHIICDGWSVAILLRDMAEFYSAYRESRPAQLPELAIHYQDFARWQQEQEQRDELALQLPYWKEQLKGIPPVVELPTDQPRSWRKTFDGSAISFCIAKDVTSALSSLAGAEDATMFMVLAAAFSTLLFRYSGQEDICVGTPAAGRNRSEFEDLIGFFVNTLVLRTRLSDEMTFRELLRSTREICLGAYAHQDVPFERLVEDLHPERDLGHSPLFQVMLDLQNAPAQPARFNDLRAALLPVSTETAKFDLTLTLYETADGFEAALEYSTELFERATICRMAENFRTLIGSIAAHPDIKLSALPVLTEEQKSTLLVEWNGARIDDSNWPPVHRAFEQQVKKIPNQIAAVCDGQSLSYRELNHRANRLAHYIRDCGAGPEVLTGICLERSLDMVIAALAVLKAGAAYVPLDPSHPHERLNAIIKDSGVDMVLTKAAFLQSLPQSGVRVICLDSDAAVIGSCSNENTRLDVWADSAAYVIYTSGSTGRPKGVVVSHRNLAHSTQSRILYYREPPTAFLLLPPFSFDSSVAGLFWTLCCGGTLVIPREGVHFDPAYLAGLIEEHSVSHLLCLPGIYDLLLQHAGHRLSAIRTAIVAGEICPVALVRCHRDLLPDARLFNEYGPTEATVWSSVFDCAAATRAGSVPIGRPMINTQIYLLDHDLELVPTGAVGEMYIGGAGVARGYLHCPELTADRFITDPFSTCPGARLYRTGDLARHQSSGDIEFLGRNDSQVKIRGHRIEPGEIEAALLDHPAVHQAAVVSKESGLSCYVVLKQLGGAAPKDLRRHLGRKLPNYMVPSEFLFLSSLPLTASGKVDRKALALHSDENAGLVGSDYVAPQSALEQVLAGILASVLGRERLGTYENFFEAGGHSLLATQAVSRIREALQVDLALRRIFEEPTVAGLAAAILSNSGERKRVTRTAELLVALSGVPDEKAPALIEKVATPISNEGMS